MNQFGYEKMYGYSLDCAIWGLGSLELNL